MANILDFENIQDDSVTINFDGKEINVKKHIYESEKIEIAKNIAKIYFIDLDDFESGLTGKDLKNSIYTYYLIKYYTDLEIPKNVSYAISTDIVTISGLLDKILSCIPLNERANLSKIIDDTIEYEKFRIVQENSVENQLKRFIEYIEQNFNKDNLLKLLNEAKDGINGFDLSKFPMINEALKTFNSKEIPDIKKTQEFVDQMIPKMSNED